MKKREEVNIFSVEIIVDSHAVLVICVCVCVYIYAFSSVQFYQTYRLVRSSSQSRCWTDASQPGPYVLP